MSRPADPPQLTILHAIANLDVGGAQEVVRSLAPALERHGCRAVVATLRDGPLRADLEAAGIPVHVLRGRQRSLVRDPRAVPELWDLRTAFANVVRTRRVDVVQTHLLRSLDFLLLTLQRRGTPRVAWTFHNARLDLRADQLPSVRYLLGMKQRGYRSMYHYASRHVSAMIAVSDEVATSIRRDIRPARGRLVTIPNGVDLARYEAPVDRSSVRAEIGLPPDALLAICVAKLYEQKGHRVLLDALSALEPAGPSLHVALVGTGPLAMEIEAAARLAGLDRVHLLGERSDVPALLGASDMFVLPSLWEGMPMALLEAMASGLPVVASRVSGTEEVLAGGAAGILVEPGDAVGLAEAMQRVALDPALRVSLAAEARRRVKERFSVDVQAREYATLYRRIVARRVA